MILRLLERRGSFGVLDTFLAIGGIALAVGAIYLIIFAIGGGSAREGIERMVVCFIFLAALSVISGLALLAFWLIFNGISYDNGLMVVGGIIVAIFDYGLVDFWFLGHPR